MDLSISLVRSMKRILTLSILFVSIFLMSACNGNAYHECTPIYVFDTVVNMVFYQDGYEECYKNIKTKLNEISRDTNDFSSNDKNNSVYDLNISRELLVSETLKDIIVYADGFVSETEGYFNPYMGRLNHKWKDAINENKVLSQDEIDNELNIISATSVEVDGNKVKINGEGNIDLGGVVKGYALEWTKKYLDENNITKYYLDFGSSSIYIGDYEQQVLLKNPYNSGYYSKYKTKNVGIASSSGEHQNIVIDGVRYHHLINPFTGYPSNYYEAISVVGNKDNGALDAYSTAIFSMDDEKSTKFASSKGIELHKLYKDGTASHLVY